MSEPVSDLPQVYEELTGRVRSHLKKIRAIPKKHPEYTVALLIAVASEGLSQLRGESRWGVFRQLLERRCKVSELVAHGLFRAVRNGLAHRYDTAMIEVGSQKIVVVVTWNKPRKHLCVERGDWLKDGVQRLGVWLDTETLWRDLLAYLRKMDNELRANRKLARSIRDHGRHLDDNYTVRPEKEEPAEVWQGAWEAFLNERRDD